MPYLWFSSPVPVWTKPAVCRSVSHVQEAGEVLLYDWPSFDDDDPTSIKARKACLAALISQDGADVEKARAAFEAAARVIGILASDSGPWVRK